jgi:hypothetical protein
LEKKKVDFKRLEQLTDKEKAGFTASSTLEKGPSFFK